LVYVWDAATGRRLYTLRGHAGAVYALNFSINGALLASGSEDGLVIVWSMNTGNKLHTLHGHGAAITAVAFSPAGNLLTTAAENGTVFLWSPRTGQRLASLSGHEGYIRDLAFSPDGKLLAGASINGLWVWSVDSGEVQGPLDGSPLLQTVAFSPDGEMLVAGNNWGNVRFWDLATGKQLDDRGIHSFGDAVLRIKLSADGQYLAALYHDRSVVLWKLAGAE
jgi:WD40 repeat protein